MKASSVGWTLESRRLPLEMFLLWSVIAYSHRSEALNVSQSFSQGRVSQELEKDGALSFSELFASNRPCNAPLAGLGLRLFLLAF